MVGVRGQRGSGGEARRAPTDRGCTQRGRGDFKQRTRKQKQEKRGSEFFILLSLKQASFRGISSGSSCPQLAPPHFLRMLINCFIPFPIFLPIQLSTGLDLANTRPPRLVLEGQRAGKRALAEPGAIAPSSSHTQLGARPLPDSEPPGGLALGLCRPVEGKHHINSGKEHLFSLLAFLLHGLFFKKKKSN